MKTVFRTKRFSVFQSLVLAGCLVSAPAFAIPPNAPAPIAAPAAAPAASNDTVSNLAGAAANVAPTTTAGAAAPTPLAGGTTAPAVATPSPAVPAPPAPTAEAADAPWDDKLTDKSPTLENEESSVPKSVNKIMKHLSKESEDITLSDLNSARQAIAKIETLIELEKKLGELEKVQKDREDKKNTMTAMPASMLMPQQVQQPVVTQFVPPPSIMNDVDIDRIIGGSGSYKAIIKTLDGTLKTVQVGDSLNGGTVSKISAAEMEITRNGDKQVVHVKNVDMVFGGSP